MPRLFVAGWPSDGVRDVLERVPRPDDAALRWTRREQWHVTLAFLGEVDEGSVPALTAALTAVAERRPARPVDLGPATCRLGRSQLVVPAAGVDDLAAELEAAAAATLGREPEGRPFRGHLTLARSRGRRPVPRTLEGIPVEASWLLAEVALVRSRLGDGPARYDTLAAARLTAG